MGRLTTGTVDDPEQARRRAELVVTQRGVLLSVDTVYAQQHTPFSYSHLAAPVRLSRGAAQRRSASRSVRPSLPDGGA